MAWLIIDLWPSLCRGVLLLALTVLPLAFLVVFSDRTRAPLVYAIGGMVVAALLVSAWRNRWVWKCAIRTRRFQTVSDDRIVVRYAPQPCERRDPRHLLDAAEQGLTELESRFGRLALSWKSRWWAGWILFRRRVHVYIFPTAEAVQEVFGSGYAGGVALIVPHHAVVVAFDERTLSELLRHELAHLFAGRWNLFVPPLFGEGLPTWLQRSIQGEPIDTVATVLLRRGGWCLRPLLDRAFFFRESNRGSCYFLAGSFTGFLIQRFGWDAYRRFYSRMSSAWWFDAAFHSAFGLTLEEAEEQWWGELLRL